jgi:hypothetical protein
MAIEVVVRAEVLFILVESARRVVEAEKIVFHAGHLILISRRELLFSLT